LFTLLTAEIGEPVALLARAGAISVLDHVRERVVADVALAVALLDAPQCLLNDLQEVTGALCALIPTRAFGAPLDVALHANIVFQEIAVDALGATVATAGARNAVRKFLATLDLVVLVKEVAMGLFDTTRPREVCNGLQVSEVRARQGWGLVMAKGAHLGGFGFCRVDVDAVNALGPLFRAEVARLVLQEVAFDASLACEVVHALETLLAVEISAVVALVEAVLVILRFALLHAERNEGGHHEAR